jgi:hypothetical protein
MSSDHEDKTQGGAAPALPGTRSGTSRPGTIRAVLQVRQAADTPFEGIVEVGTGRPRAFHGWLELMGLIEEARANAGP